MRAAVYDSFHEDPTSPGAVLVRDRPEPRVMPGSVLIDVRAAGVNPSDWQLITGEMADLIETVFPAIPGQDVAGVVVAVGADTPEFTVGDEVMGFLRHHVVYAGTFAERVAAPASWLARKPAALSWVQAGALPVAGVTALRVLDTLGLRAADTLLVHAATGGVGTLAVQLAVARGARVIVCAQSRVSARAGSRAGRLRRRVVRRRARTGAAGSDRDRRPHRWPAGVHDVGAGAGRPARLRLLSRRAWRIGGARGPRPT